MNNCLSDLEEKMWEVLDRICLPYDKFQWWDVANRVAEQLYVFLEAF